jgi:hypothetical protein
VEAAVRALLPRALEESGLVQRLTAAPLRWTPTEISVSSFYDTRISRS